MLDAFLPAAEAFQEAVHSGLSVSDALCAAATAAAAGTRVTAGMMPRRGRSSYLEPAPWGTRIRLKRSAGRDLFHSTSSKISDDFASPPVMNDTLMTIRP